MCSTSLIWRESSLSSGNGQPPKPGGPGGPGNPGKPGEP